MSGDADGKPGDLNRVSCFFFNGDDNMHESAITH